MGCWEDQSSVQAKNAGSAWSCGCDMGCGQTGHFCEIYPDCTFGKAWNSVVVEIPAMLGKKHGHPKFYKLIEEICELHDRKNADYAKDSDPLSNFRQSEGFGIPAWKGALVRMADKWSRIQELSKGKTAQNESMRDSFVDLAVYSLLTIILMEEAQSGD